MKLYKWYGGKIESVEVEETAKTYRALSGTGMAFNYKRIFHKSNITAEGIALTEKGALRIAKSVTENSIDKIFDRLKRLNDELNAINQAIDEQGRVQQENSQCSG